MMGIIKKFILAFIVVVLAACGGGSGSTTTGPTAVIQGNMKAVTNGSTSTLQAAVGSTVNLDGSGSNSPGSSITAYAWSLDSKPDACAATLGGTAAATTSFVPDVTGTYKVTLKVTDASGASAAETITIVVSQGIPVINVTNNVTFSGLSQTKPAQNVSVGSIITLDGSASTDPNGGTVTISWLILQRPADSSTTLGTNGNIANFSIDAPGQYQVRVRGTNSSGAYSDVTYIFNAINTSPSIVVAANVTSLGSSTTINAAVGYNVLLDSSASTAPIGDTVTKSWVVLSRPSGSTASLSTASGNAVTFIPDAAGTYTIQLNMVDTTTGLNAFYTVKLQVRQSPTAVISGNASPVALASAPSFVATAGTPVTLRGSGSYDPDGSVLTFAWTILSKPASSTTTISTPSKANITVTPDVNGSYTLQLSVTDPYGTVSTQPVTINVGSYPPVALVDHSQVAALLGNRVTASAASSYDQDGNPLTFNWSIDSAPAGSSATIANPTSSTLTFTPDVAGTYYATVTVSDGPINTVAAVTITALSASSGTVPLAYKPLQSKFSKGLGKAVIIATNPNSLHIVDPNAATDVSVALPTSAKSLCLSPDGKLAAVLHEGVVTLVDLQAGVLVYSSATGGSQTDVFVSNSGLLYLTGQTGGQWVTPSFTVLNGRTGATVQTVTTIGEIYGTTKGIYSDVSNKIFTISEGLSPAQIYAYKVDPGTGLLGTYTGSPYWGDYAMYDPFWLSSDQSLLFTAAGTYFNSSDLTYVGKFGFSVVSMSHSSTAQEAVVFVSGTNYPSVYKRFTGSLLLPANDVPLPTIGGQQSYGVSIYHASDDSHVMVVQTGTAQPNGVGAQYYLIKR